MRFAWGWLSLLANSPDLIIPMELPPRHDVSDPRVDMIPLVDVIFLVLVAFIYASMFLTQKTGLPVDLPDASQSELERLDVMTITITRDGTLFLNKQAVSPVELEQALSLARTNNPDIRLFVMADQDARLDPLVIAMDIARKVGIEGLTIATERNAAVRNR